MLGWLRNGIGQAQFEKRVLGIGKSERVQVAVAELQA